MEAFGSMAVAHHVVQQPVLPQLFNWLCAAAAANSPC